MAMTDERSAERTAERALVERGKAVDAALATIEKQFGRGAIMKLGSRVKLVLDTIPTGALDPPAVRPKRPRAPRQPAGHRRAGARDHRDAHPLRRDRLRGRRLGRGARAP